LIISRGIIVERERSEEVSKCDRDIDTDRREMNTFLFRTMTDMQSDVRSLVCKMTAFEISQNEVIIPRLDGLHDKITELDKRIRGNGKIGLEGRIQKVENNIDNILSGVTRIEDDMYNEEKGVIPYITKNRIKTKIFICASTALGTTLGLMASFLSTPVWVWVAAFFKVKGS
jgi:hypothetical protein